MNLLDEVISEKKFERNIKILKKIILFAVILGGVLIAYVLYVSNKEKQAEAYNANITQEILDNFALSNNPSKKLTEFNKILNIEQMPINTIKQFSIIKNNIEYFASQNEKNIDITKQNSFNENVYIPLKDLISSSDILLQKLAKKYLAMLMLDMNYFFNKEDVSSYFISLEMDEENFTSDLIILKAIWIKNNLNKEETSKYLSKYIKKIKEQNENLLKSNLNSILINNSIKTNKQVLFLLTYFDMLNS